MLASDATCTTGASRTSVAASVSALAMADSVSASRSSAASAPSAPVSVAGGGSGSGFMPAGMPGESGTGACAGKPDALALLVRATSPSPAVSVPSTGLPRNATSASSSASIPNPPSVRDSRRRRRARSRARRDSDDTFVPVADAAPSIVADVPVLEAADRTDALRRSTQDAPPPPDAADSMGDAAPLSCDMGDGDRDSLATAAAPSATEPRVLFRAVNAAPPPMVPSASSPVLSSPPPVPLRRVVSRRGRPSLAVSGAAAAAAAVGAPAASGKPSMSPPPSAAYTRRSAATYRSTRPSLPPALPAASRLRANDATSANAAGVTSGCSALRALPAAGAPKARRTVACSAAGRRFMCVRASACVPYVGSAPSSVAGAGEAAGATGPPAPLPRPPAPVGVGAPPMVRGDSVVEVDGAGAAAAADCSVASAHSASLALTYHSAALVVSGAVYGSGAARGGDPGTCDGAEALLPERTFRRMPGTSSGGSSTTRSRRASGR